MNQRATNQKRPDRRQSSPVKLAFALSAMLILGSVAFGKAELTNSLESEVKAAFLVKLGMFVEWPTNQVGAASEAFLIGVLGDDPFGPRFDEAVKRESVSGRPVEIRRGNTPADLLNCKIVFIGSVAVERRDEWLNVLTTNGVLTVSDELNFASAGGMIGFVKESGRIRFEINHEAAERAGLKLSSKLLQVGRRVSDSRQKG